MKTLTIKSESGRINKVRKLIRSVGNQIGSVHFIRRSDGKLRKMAYRLRVQSPTYATKPTGKRFLQKKERDEANLQITVFDVNKIRRDKNGRMCGRGDWRTIPLENVRRLCVGGTIYRVVSNS